MKILILSTPKTGNTWLMSLLSAVYDLPKLGLVCPFDRGQASTMGSRWIAFHHFTPEPQLVDWIRQERPYLLTTVRHPGDVLVSLYHHLRDFSAEPVNADELRALLHTPFERKEIYPPASHTFCDELDCSIEWKKTGLTRVVRYEDLRRNTMETLLALTQWMAPVSIDRLERAIARCDIDQMRAMAGKHGGFFRSGSVGGWRDILSSEIIDDFSAAPYRSQFEELGYSLEPETGETCLVEEMEIRNPFREVKSFDNGVPVAPIIVDYFLSMDSSVTACWLDVRSTGPASYFAWLKQPRVDSEAGAYGQIGISNLLWFMYEGRPDLTQGFPNLRGLDRARFAEWLIRYARRQFGIDTSFLTDLHESYLAWGIARSEEDRRRRPWWPRLTNYAMHAYHFLPGLREAFPDVCARDRWDFLEWMTDPNNGLPAFPELIDPIRENLERVSKVRWMIERASHLRELLKNQTA